jgi:NAD(P)-dependent dehydrogenase (short-subunit alcohol dehydrogenase family)
MIENKVCVITGVGSGIGKSIAQVFARYGAIVVGCDRDAVNGQKVIGAIAAQGDNSQFVCCDISCDRQVGEMVDKVVSRQGRIDVLVNNAGINFAKPFLETTVEEWDRVLNTDLRGTYLCCRAVIPNMLRSGGGSIINIGTVHTVACLPGAAPYDAAKWGVVGLSKALAVEFADRNIRVNVLSPGLIATKIWDDIKAAAPDVEKAMEHWRANIPMQRVGEPEEIAELAVFLASDRARYMTGANIIVDGGMTSQLISREPH